MFETQSIYSDSQECDPSHRVSPYFDSDDDPTENPLFGRFGGDKRIRTESTPSSDYSSDWRENLRKAADRLADVMRIRLELLQLKSRVATLERQIGHLTAISGSVVQITTFGTEPYEATKAISVTVSPREDEFVTVFSDANLSAHGDNASEAVGHLKILILDVFDNLNSKPRSKLGPSTLAQLAVLNEFVRKHG